MRRVREILRLKHECGASDRAIGRSLGIARSTVALTLDRVAAAGLAWPLSATLGDHVLEAMLRRLGAEIGHADMPFCPEGGAYGHGRTFGHSHDPSARPAHDPDHHHHA